jgi:hypothetical protein
MKKLILFIIYGLPFLSFSQTISYDFKEGKPPKNDTANLGDYVVFKVENINTFIYDVKIEGKQTNLHTEGADVFLNLQLEPESSSDSQIKEESKSLIDNQSTSEEIKDFIKSNSIIKNAQFNLEMFQEELYEFE